MSVENLPEPSDFDSYWRGVMEELAALPPAPELKPQPLGTTDFATLYEVRLTSIGPYRIFAHYSVPHGSGPFPVIYHAPRYGSVVHIAPYEERQRYVTVSLRHRGQRLADKPFAAAYPGLLTRGIESRQSYIYRGIVADCCRILDFLVERPEVDRGRIAIVGDDLALITAALHGQVDALYWSPTLFYAARQLAARTSGYPLEELNDYARAYPEQAEAMWQTLAYFDPIYFAPKVRADSILVTGNEHDLFSPQTLAPLVSSFTAPVTTYESQHSSYRDGVHEMTWIAQRYGFGEPILPPHWR